MGSFLEKVAISLGVTAIAGIVMGAIIVSNISAHNHNSGAVYAEQAERIETVTETNTIEYKTLRIENPDLPEGQEEIRQKGENGEETRMYNVTYRGDKIVSKKLIKTERTKEPVTEIVMFGTKKPWTCYDATSYDRNPYNDNLCVNNFTGERRYVDDCEATKLDLNFVPSKRGAAKYNKSCR